MPALSTVYDVCLLDLDGVVYIGADAAPHAQDALAAARADGMGLAFVTNNASRPPGVVAEHLCELGIDTTADEIVTSAQAAARLLAERLPRGASVLVIGGAGLVEAVRERGLTPVSSAADDPAAVVQGFDPAVDWRMLAEGAYAVGDGLPWVASNADTSIPTARGVAPGNGALVGAITAATGREPEVAGKPEPPLHTETVLRTGARRPLIVGDRLDTDIEGANRSGVDSLLVFTGLTTPDMVATAEPRYRPTHIGPDLRALAGAPEDVRIDISRSAYGQWKATVRDGRVAVERSDPAGDPAGDAAGGAARVGTDDPGMTTPPWSTRTQHRLDGLRAICAAVWADDGGPVEGVADALAEVGW